MSYLVNAVILGGTVWALSTSISGFRNGSMEPMGSSVNRVMKSENPLLFWLYAAFNLLMVCVGTMLLFTSAAWQ